MKVNVLKVFFAFFCIFSFCSKGIAANISSSLNNAVKICEWTNTVEFYYSVKRPLPSGEYQEKLLPKVSLYYSGTDNMYEVVFQTVKGDRLADNGYKTTVGRVKLSTENNNGGLFIKADDIRNFNSNVTDRIGQLADEELARYLSKYECPPYAYIPLPIATSQKPFYSEFEYTSYINNSNSPNLDYSPILYSNTVSNNRAKTTETQKILESKKSFDLLELVNGNELDAAVENYIKHSLTVDMSKSFNENEFCKNMSNENYNKEYYNNAVTSLLKNTIVTKYLDTSIDPNMIPDKFLKTGVFNRFSSVADNLEELKSQCQELLENEEISSEEKEQIEETMDENVANTKDALEKYAGIMAKDTFEFDWGNGEEENCQGFLGTKEDKTSPAYYLGLIMDLMRYGAIILVFILSVMDFLKAVTSQDKEQLNKAVRVSAKRLIAAVIIFFLPILIEFILSFVGAYDTCGF